jgi:beta-lactamase class A
MRRREFISSSVLLLPGACASLPPPEPKAPASPFESGCAALERENGGRLGVAIIDTASGRRAAWRGDERFPLCSTFKLPLAGAVLARVDAGKVALDGRVRFGRRDLVPYAPVVEKELARGWMTIEALCVAAVTVSDNAAANLLLGRIGGPPALTAFLRSLGDAVTRLDRIEPALNAVAPGDERDTTSPGAMAETIRRLLLGGDGGDPLSPRSRERLVTWAMGTSTGPGRLRAGLPAPWPLAHKTGTGEEASNDVGVAWAPGGPLVVSAYYVAPGVSPPAREAVLAGVGRLAGYFRDTAHTP